MKLVKCFNCDYFFLFKSTSFIRCLSNTEIECSFERKKKLVIITNHSSRPFFYGFYDKKKFDCWFSDFLSSYAQRAVWDTFIPFRRCNNFFFLLLRVSKRTIMCFTFEFHDLNLNLLFCLICNNTKWINIWIRAQIIIIQL